jgi:hypothetical protein
MNPEMIHNAVRMAYLAVSKRVDHTRKQREESDNKPEGEEAIRVEYCTARYDKPLDYRLVAQVREPRRY